MAKAPRALNVDIKQVWIDYKKEKTEPLRNILMENYLHLVRYNAERIHVKLPDEVELDDLMSAGIFGLMDAIAAFDLGKLTGKFGRVGTAGELYPKPARRCQRRSHLGRGRRGRDGCRSNLLRSRCRTGGRLRRVRRLRQPALD